jgi:hypothetical protein
MLTYQFWGPHNVLSIDLRKMSLLHTSELSKIGESYAVFLAFESFSADREILSCHIIRRFINLFTRARHCDLT